MRAAVIVPTLNAGDLWREVVAAIQFQDCLIDDVIVIDSGSLDSTVKITEEACFRVYSINKKNFNHGATRQKALNYLTKIDVAIYLTQDAVLKDKNVLNAILAVFNDPSVGAAYGRQLPRKNAKPLEAHARHFNYPDKSLIKSISDRELFGIKTVFLSNSFAAYRVSALNEIGGFPDNIIASEDTYVAAKLVLNDYKIAYCAEAEVYHSHDYSYLQEFKRYFDMGVFHARTPWIRQEFGSAEGEGIKFLQSELDFLLEHAFWKIPEALIRTLFRYTGFRLGLLERLLPLRLKSALSMNSSYFR